MDQNSQASKYAWPFTLEEFLKKEDAEDAEEASDEDEEANNEDEESVTVEQTLQLLERLGLVVQVVPSADSTHYYRRVTKLDSGTESE